MYVSANLSGLQSSKRYKQLLLELQRADWKWLRDSIRVLTRLEANIKRSLEREKEIKIEKLKWTFQEKEFRRRKTKR